MDLDMNDALGIFAPFSFGDPTMEKVERLHATPLAGAIYDWASDGLSHGELQNWRSLVNGEVLTSDTGYPTVITSGNTRAVSFDGVDDRMRIQFNKATPYTLLAVFRLVAPRLGDGIVLSYNGLAGGSITVGSSVDTIAGYAGSTWLTPAPDIPADTSWHVAMVTFNGAQSVIRVDDKERVGELPIVNRDGITLGFSTATGGRAAIEYKRVSVLDGATPGWQRNSIYNMLKNRYDIP